MENGKNEIGYIQYVGKVFMVPYEDCFDDMSTYYNHFSAEGMMEQEILSKVIKGCVSGTFNIFRFVPPEKLNEHKPDIEQEEFYPLLYVGSVQGHYCCPRFGWQYKMPLRPYDVVVDEKGTAIFGNVSTLLELPNDETLAQRRAQKEDPTVMAHQARLIPPLYTGRTYP